MKINSKIFDRINSVANHYDLDGIPELAKKLGYISAEKLYRLNRTESAKPSFDIIYDFATAFDSLNLRWFITGKGEIEGQNTNEFTNAAEPAAVYQKTDSGLIGMFATEVVRLLEPRLYIQDKKIKEIADCLSLKEEIELSKRTIKKED